MPTPVPISHEVHGEAPENLRQLAAAVQRILSTKAAECVQANVVDSSVEDQLANGRVLTTHSCTLSMDHRLVKKGLIQFYL